MIFENVNSILQKDEFIEKILIYIRLVEVTAEQYNLTINTHEKVNDDITNELISIGVISSAADLPKLKDVTKSLYQRLIDSVGLYLIHRTLFSDRLDKLSNSKRKKIISQLLLISLLVQVD